MLKETLSNYEKATNNLYKSSYDIRELKLIIRSQGIKLDAKDVNVMAIKNINEQLVQEIEDLNKDIRKLKRKAFWGKVVAFIAGAASGLIVAIIAL